LFYSNVIMVEAASHTETGLHGVNTKKVQFESPNFTEFLRIPNVILMHCSISNQYELN